MTKRYCGFLVIVALILAPTMAESQQESSGNGKIHVPMLVLDLGQVAQGISAEANFEIVNEGDGVLEIRAVRPTCGCTVAEFDREIEPGTKGMIRAKLNTKGFNGPISKSILVMTNDPVSPTTTLVIKAMVKPYVEVLPRPLVRFNATQREPSTQTVTLISDTGDFSITNIEADVDYLKVNSRKLEGSERMKGKDGTQYELEVVLTEDAPVGPVNVTAVVQTSHPKAPEVSIRAFGVVRSLIHVTPSRLQFGNVDTKVKPSRNVMVINNRPDKQVKVTGAEVNDSAFATAVEMVKEGSRYKISVTVNEDAAAGSRDAVLTIKTDDPQFPELTVSVRADIR
ncbi:MAG: DUF1573 domain-containing protein [bacterium]|nr:DUF1573 domain-containing protein [bacterium]